MVVWASGVLLLVSVSAVTQNIARNKRTEASSVYMASSRAVDGNKNGIFSAGSCFHSDYTDTSITSAWWRVDLGQKTLVHDVIIYFRTDNKRRRNGIQMYIADSVASPTDGVNCYNVTGNRDGTDIPDVLRVTCSGQGRYIVLYTTTRNGGDSVPILDFCEVEVNVCSVSSYGTNCSKLCPERHCKGDNSSCDHVTGQCAGGCEAGWDGPDCSEKCVNSYGDGCAYLCSSRRCDGSSSCNHVTGTCEHGCVPGWKNVDCKEACSLGLEYGANCGGICSARMCEGGSGTCPQDTGPCESGCQSGWKGTDCTQACTQGLEYGANCSGNCSARMCEGGNDTCPQDSGRCENGCQSGFKGEDCTTVCSVGSYGTNCVKLCSERHCRGDNSSCDHVTGQCVGGCQAGLDGTECTERCSNGTYGATCSGKCGQCRDFKTCHHVNGSCPDGCSDGWTDHTCTQVCSVGTYGTNCVKLCSDRHCRDDNSSCDHMTGQCVRGCEVEWDGTDCTEKLQPHDPPLLHIISLVIGVVVGVVLTLLLAAGVQLYLLRTGRLTWMRDTVRERGRRDTADANITQSPDNYTSISELPHTDGGDMDNNGYAGLDTDTRADNKLYDVIKN